MGPIDWDAIELWLDRNEDYDLRVGRYLGPGHRWRATFAHSDVGDGDDVEGDGVTMGGHLLGDTQTEAIALVSQWARGQL